jgi:hypothetical protein
VAGWALLLRENSMQQLFCSMQSSRQLNSHRFWIVQRKKVCMWDVQQCRAGLEQQQRL